MTDETTNTRNMTIAELERYCFTTGKPMPADRVNDLIAENSRLRDGIRDALRSVIDRDGGADVALETLEDTLTELLDECDE